jgi:ABC-2 type transport system ATP-binding protein
MQMRLGFAVAAFLEPDVLLVDEVLAVGDATFQQRCLDRMRTVLAEGTTLVYVSHDLATVEATCSRGVWLSDGVVRETGTISDTINAYRRSIEEMAETATSYDGDVRLLKARVDRGGELAKTNEDLDVTLVFESSTSMQTGLFLGVSEGTATPVFVLRSDVSLADGETEVRCHIERLPLPRGRYYLWAGQYEVGSTARPLFPWRPIANFEVMGPKLDQAPKAVVRMAPVYVKAAWDIGPR